MILGSATTLLGVAGQLFTPIVPRTPTSGENGLTGYSSGFPDEPEYYEKILAEIARREKAGRSWKMHVITGVVNLGSGLITWKGFHRSFAAGVGNFALNTLVTELQIWTQPTRAVKDYQRYCNKYGIEPNGFNPRIQDQWVVSASPGGFSVKFNF